jgi:hypothetical protein
LNNEPKQNGNKSKKIENDDSENEDSVEEWLFKFNFNWNQIKSTKILFI